jgi:hypothetical protein
MSITRTLVLHDRLALLQARNDVLSPDIIQLCPISEIASDDDRGSQRGLVRPGNASPTIFQSILIDWLLQLLEKHESRRDQNTYLDDHHDQLDLLRRRPGVTGRRAPRLASG